MLLLLIILIIWSPSSENTACRQFSAPNSRCYKDIHSNASFYKRLTQCSNGLLAIHSEEEIYDAAMEATKKDYCPVEVMNALKGHPPRFNRMPRTLIHLGMKKGKTEWINGEKMDYQLTGFPSVIAGDCANLVYFQCNTTCISPGCDYWHFQARCSRKSHILCSGKIPSKKPDTVHATVPAVKMPVIFVCFFQTLLSFCTLGAGIFLFMVNHNGQLKKYYKAIGKVVQLSSTMEGIEIPDPALEDFLLKLGMSVLQVRAEKENENRRLMEYFPGSPLLGLPLDQSVPWKLKSVKSAEKTETTKPIVPVPRLPSPVSSKHDSSVSVSAKDKKNSKMTKPKNEENQQKPPGGNQLSRSVDVASNAQTTQTNEKGSSKIKK